MKNAFIDATGILVSWGYAESNNDDTLIEVPEDFSMAPGQAQYANGVWSAYTPPVDYVAVNTFEQTVLMNAANVATSGQGDAYMLGLLDADDTATFKAWAAYKLALSKVDLTQQTPAWPAVPSS